MSQNFSFPVKNEQRRYILMLLCIGLISIAGIAAVLYGTYWGPIMASDGAGYINSARNVIAGNGLVTIDGSGEHNLQTSNPPLYPLLLAAFGKSGFDMVDSIRWLNAILFGATISFGGLLIYCTTHSTLLSMASCTLIATSPLIIKAYIVVQTDSLFVCAMCAGIFLLMLFFERTNWQLLVASAVVFSIAVVTRYIGVALPIIGAISILVLLPTSWKRRWISALVFGFISSLPLAIWFVWLQFQSKAEPIRQVKVAVESIQQTLVDFRLTFVNDLWSWLPFTSATPFLHLHYRYKLLILLIIVILVLVLAGLALRRIYRQNMADHITRLGICSLVLSIIFFAVYMTILLLSAISTIPRHGLPERYLMPVQVVLILDFMVIFGLILRAWAKQKWLVILPLSATLIFAATNFSFSRDLIISNHINGSGYTSPQWRDSGLIEALQNIPESIPLISNEPDAIRFLTNRPCYRIYEITFQISQPVGLKYGDYDDPSQSVFRAEKAALILFNTTFHWQMEPLYGEQTDQRLQAFTEGLPVYLDTWDGKIYFYSEDFYP